MAEQSTSSPKLQDADSDETMSEEEEEEVVEYVMVEEADIKDHEATQHPVLGETSIDIPAAIAEALEEDVTENFIRKKSIRVPNVIKKSSSSDITNQPSTSTALPEKVVETTKGEQAQKATSSSTVTKSAETSGKRAGQPSGNGSSPKRVSCEAATDKAGTSGNSTKNTTSTEEFKKPLDVKPKTIPDTNPRKLLKRFVYNPTVSVTKTQMLQQLRIIIMDGRLNGTQTFSYLVPVLKKQLDNKLASKIHKEIILKIFTAMFLKRVQRISGVSVETCELIIISIIKAQTYNDVGDCAANLLYKLVCLGNFHNLAQCLVLLTYSPKVYKDFLGHIIEILRVFINARCDEFTDDKLLDQIMCGIGYLYRYFDVAPIKDISAQRLAIKCMITLYVNMGKERMSPFLHFIPTEVLQYLPHQSSRNETVAVQNPTSGTAENI